jgi:hypothetical protein
VVAVGAAAVEAEDVGVEAMEAAAVVVAVEVVVEVAVEVAVEALE